MDSFTPLTTPLAFAPAQLPAVAAPSDSNTDGNGHAGPSKSSKRKTEGPPKPKNLQACDRCRVKTKCEAVGHPSACQACHSASLACTFDMPLTASRTKRVRRGMSAINGGDVSLTLDDNHEDDAQSTAGSSGPSPLRAAQDPRVRPLTTSTRHISVRREGPTSMPFILHSTPTLPLSSIADWDQTYGYSMYVTPADSGDGFVLVAPDPSDQVSIHTPPESVLDALLSSSWTEVVSRLVETFMVHISPLIPIVERDDLQDASQALLYAMAAVAAVRRNCPQQIFDALRFVLKREMQEHDTLSDPTRENVQILLVSCLVDELSMQGGAAQPAHVQRTRLSAAIRMAQDLSMDRPGINSLAPADKRIWECAVIIDQWNAARHGARPIVPISAECKVQSRSDIFINQLVVLTNLLARVLATVYGPDGIKHIKNETLNELNKSINHFISVLPARLQYDAMQPSVPAGLLYMLHTAVKFLLYRPFMRWSFICPSTLELNMDLGVWVDLSTRARKSIEWAAQIELADVQFFGPYALGLCGLIQYHTWARRKEWDGFVTLEKASRDVVQRWTAGMADGHLSLQRAQLSAVTLLYAASQEARPDGSFTSGKRGLNPTPGSLNRLPETSISGVTFLRDPSHPRGGVLVATAQAAREIQDLPPDTVIIGAPPPVPTGVADGVQNQVTPTTATYLSAMIGGDVGDSGRIGISTPDWEACINQYMFPGFDVAV